MLRVTGLLEKVIVQKKKAQPKNSSRSYNQNPYRGQEHYTPMKKWYYPTMRNNYQPKNRIYLVYGGSKFCNSINLNKDY